MKSSRKTVWLTASIERLILDGLEGKATKESVLFAKVQSKADFISYVEFEKALMTLEIGGKIRVQHTLKDDKLVSPE